MNKEKELNAAKTRALLLLLAATATFVVTVFLPRSAWVDALKAGRLVCGRGSVHPNPDAVSVHFFAHGHHSPKQGQDRRQPGGFCAGKVSRCALHRRADQKA
jgi:hypothetical protein